MYHLIPIKETATMKFTLTIDCDNAAFDPEADGVYPGTETARILRDVAGSLEGDGFEPGTSWPLFDINGARVGAASVEGQG